MRGSLWQLGQSITRRLAQADKRVVACRFFASEADLKKTVLYDFHVANGGKMVPFAGWSMPIQYKDSIMDSTVNCRVNGGLFDVSHMCGLSLKGNDCVPFLEKLVIADVAGLAPGTGTLTVFTNEKGGAIDDSVITKVKDDHIYLVVNAGCRDKDLAHIEEHMKAFKAKGGDVSWHIHDERSLLALQGPLAAPVLQHLTKDDLSKLYFGEFRILDINGATCYLTRTGYTGEDGFEISVPSENALDLAKAILEKSEGKVRLTGLGARDSLRLEAGLCLYGNDMEQHITPVEAGLTWAIGKRRRAEGGFLGAEVILKQLAEGPSIRRVGFVSTGPPPRSHSEIQDEKGNNIGEITSGGFSPCLKKNIAMGYVKSGSHKAGTKAKILFITKIPPFTFSSNLLISSTLIWKTISSKTLQGYIIVGWFQDVSGIHSNNLVHIHNSLPSWKDSSKLPTHLVSHRVIPKRWLCQSHGSASSDDEYRSSRNIAISLFRRYRNAIDRGGGDNLKEFISAGVNAYALGCTDEGLRKELIAMKESGIEIEEMHSYGRSTSLKSKICAEEVNELSDDVLHQWKGFCALIANAYFIRGMAWLPVKTLQLEQMAVIGRAEEPSVVASRMRLVFSTLEVVSPQWPRV
ncbi:hypothetical protein V6N12_063933 [Hibiscus sabdariffa]|uniref:Aminomethyltransferase, mitochondrial n=1 Tax=Hibiscus sabdariffa TaxID=183260 RepID=A0ABR2AT72_9ROSI